MENTASNSTLLIPARLAEVLESLGVNQITPSSWNVNVNEVDCTLSISWNRDDKTHINRNSAVKLFSDAPDVYIAGNFDSIPVSSKESSDCKTQTAKNDKNVKENSDAELNDCRENSSTMSTLRPSHSNRRHDNNHLVYNGLPSNVRFHSNKATCSCGEQFVFKERAIKHILFSCPISLCFRIDLDLRVHDVIDQWKDEEQRILGRKWWHAYKTSGVPDVMGTCPVTSVDQLEEMINSFIAKAGTNELLDQNQNRFVLIKGLEELPYELGPLIG